jgi:tRNA dimethylallyltransferase
MNHDNYLLVIVGPTAVGKTQLCIDLAKQFGTEVISADSRQFYREMSIGTAKPTKDEMSGVKHHFVDNLSIATTYDVGQYEQEVMTTLTAIFQTKKVVILTGGSGLYIDAICNGIDDMPDIPPGVRSKLNDLLIEKGLDFLTAQLKEVDAQYYEQVDLKNPQRVIRALEVFEATGKPYSLFRKRTPVSRPFQIIKIGLERDREQLYGRIDQRMDVMIESGLFQEAKELYPYKANNALQTLGYKEIFGMMDGDYELPEAIRLLKRNSRRYAKRQMTWFRRSADIQWFHPDNFEAIIKYIKDKMP